jgi:hypothetical protein
VELQLVQLGPQRLLVATHFPQLLCQAIRLLLDAQQVTGWGRGKPPLGPGQQQAGPVHLFLQEGWAQSRWNQNGHTGSRQPMSTSAEDWLMSGGYQIHPKLHHRIRDPEKS